MDHRLGPRRQALRIGAAGFTLALALPIVLWHRVIGVIFGGFRFDVTYVVTGCSPWLLMVLGLACFVPIARDALRDPDRRFYGSPSGAWFGWGTTLYLLGFLLASQVAQIADGLSAV